jgi:hypothetical protein
VEGHRVRLVEARFPCQVPLRQLVVTLESSLEGLDPFGGELVEPKHVGVVEGDPWPGGYVWERLLPAVSLLNLEEVLSHILSNQALQVELKECKAWVLPIKSRHAWIDH